MQGVSSVPAHPTIVIEPHHGLRLDLRAIWQHRELLYFLAWRDVKARYKQTVFGAGWAILQPLMTTVIFTLVFNHLTKMPSEGVPYPVFAFTGLVVWTYVAKATERSGTSLVYNSHLISKVYFPRLLVPISAIGAPLTDFCFSLAFLAGMMGWYGVVPTWRILCVPVIIVLAIACSIGLSVFLAGLNVRFRDITQVIPFLVQIWMFASPVAYPLSVVPERWRAVYALNPMASAIEGFRWAVLGTPPPDLAVVATGLAVTAALVVGGVAVFKTLEPTFADVI
jgi:lipopolysaccharide transport system permease protein